MTKVNEMGIEMSMPAEYADKAAAVMSAGNDTGSMTIGSPEPEAIAPKRYVSVYANSITPVSHNESDAVAAFDVVFSVGVSDGNDGTRTYQVVKRIGIDKNKIADEACESTPVSIVEAKKEEKPAAPIISEAKRYRILAGLE